MKRYVRNSAGSLGITSGAGVKQFFLFLFLGVRSANPLGVPARVIERKISARLNAAACNKTRLATFSRPLTCNRRIAPAECSPDGVARSKSRQLRAVHRLSKGFFGLR